MGTFFSKIKKRRVEKPTFSNFFKDLVLP